MLKPAACSSIECLEARIAPAAVFVNTTTATYTDGDGDLVTVKFTKPILTAPTNTTASNVTDIVQVTGTSLELIDLSSVAAKAQGTGISVTVHASLAGNGLADVGTINAPAISLGTVTIAGDLGVITTVSNSNPSSTAGVAALDVYSMGRLEPAGGNGDLISNIAGAIGSLKVTGVFNGEDLTAGGNIGSVTIGGSVVGGASGGSGSITSMGNIGPVKIGGDLAGGMGGQSGDIYAAGTIASVTIGGSIIGAGTMSGVITAGSAVKTITVGRDVTGGTGDDSGLIQALSVGSVTINGSLAGGTGNTTGDINTTSGGIGVVKIALNLTGGAGSGNDNSGIIDSATGITSVIVGGSIVGGSSNDSGVILAEDGNIGPISIGRDLVGGGTDNTTSDSGEISSYAGSIAKITIGGSAIGGASPNFSGAIMAGNALGPISIGGSIEGSAPTIPFIIQAAGSLKAKGSSDVAISSLSVGGDVTNAQILAGFAVSTPGEPANNSTPVDGHVQIGAVTVGGDWNASSISAGIAPDTNGYFGTVGDTQIGAGAASIVAKIASITIDGFITGTSTSTSSTDNFGFVAAAFGPFKFAGVTVPITTGNHTPIVLSPGTGGDVAIELV
jgi:hypothetical protein